MRARYYSPELKRFINADIVAGEITNAVTLNRYAYANANPVSLVDPLGREAGRGGNFTSRFGYGDSYLEYIDERRNNENVDTTSASNSEGLFNAKLENGTVITTIYREFDLTLGTGLVKVSHTQTYSTSQTIAGGDASLVGVYAYSNQHVDAAQMDYGAGLDLFDVVNVDASISLRGLLNFEVNVSVGVSIGDYSGYIDVAIESNTNVTVSVGLSHTLDDGREINDQYSITGNALGILIAVATIGYGYFLASSGQAPATNPT